MQIPSEKQVNEEQALTTFNYAAEEIRFFKGQQWQVTNYALIAYAALAAVPSWVEPDSWRFWASWGAFVLVCVTFAAAWVVLESFGASLNKERKRRDAALALVFEIHGKIRENYSLKRRPAQPWQRTFWTRDHEQRTDRDPLIKPVFVECCPWVGSSQA